MQYLRHILLYIFITGNVYSQQAERVALPLLSTYRRRRPRSGITPCWSQTMTVRPMSFDERRAKIATHSQQSASILERQTKGSTGIKQKMEGCKNEGYAFPASKDLPQPELT